MARLCFSDELERCVLATKGTSTTAAVSGLHSMAEFVISYRTCRNLMSTASVPEAAHRAEGDLPRLLLRRRRRTRASGVAMSHVPTNQRIESEDASMMIFCS